MDVDLLYVRLSRPDLRYGSASDDPERACNLMNHHSMNGMLMAGEMVEGKEYVAIFKTDRAHLADSKAMKKRAPL